MMLRHRSLLNGRRAATFSISNPTASLTRTRRIPPTPASALTTSTSTSTSSCFSFNHAHRPFAKFPFPTIKSTGRPSLPFARFPKSNAFVVNKAACRSKPHCPVRRSHSASAPSPATNEPAAHLFKGPPPKQRSLLRIWVKSLCWVVVLAVGGVVAFVALYDNANDVPPDLSNAHFVEVAGKRKLCYADYGDPKGKVVFAFHGAGGSRMELANLVDELEGLPIRIIAIDRPGYGGSDMVAINLLDWPADVIAVADSLKIDKFSVLGVSSGGIYASACAFALPRKFPGRLFNVALVSGDGPNMLGVEELGTESTNRLNSSMLWSLRHTPWVAAWMFRLTRIFLYSSPEEYAQTVIQGMMLCAADQDAIDRVIKKKGGDVASTLLSSFEGLRPGVEGLVQDMRFQKVEPWGFKLSDITLALYGEGNIYVWHGTNDPVVPLGMAKYVAINIPAAKPRLLEQEGHVSVIINHFKEILLELTNGQPPPAEPSAVPKEYDGDVATTLPPIPASVGSNAT